MSARLRSTYSRLAIAKPLELARLLPVGADDAHAGQRLLRHGAQIGQAAPGSARSARESRVRSSVRVSVTDGNGSSAISVSRALIDSITASATTNVSAVVAAYMTAGPTIMRTALRSLVARDIRSPVRRRLEVRRAAAARDARRTRSGCRIRSPRDAPISTRRVTKRLSAADATAASNQQRAVRDEFCMCDAMPTDRRPRASGSTARPA